VPLLDIWRFMSILNSLKTLRNQGDQILLTPNRSFCFMDFPTLHTTTPRDSSPVLYSIEYMFASVRDMYSHTPSLHLPSFSPSPGCLFPPSALFFKFLRLSSTSHNHPGPYG
jgi:hypothetical protein